MKDLMRADDIYMRLLKVMERDPNFSPDEIDMFKKTELIQKSIDLVKSGAQHQAVRRNSSDQMKYVESIIGKNLVVQKSLSPKSGKNKKKVETKINLSLSQSTNRNKGSKSARNLSRTPKKEKVVRPSMGYATVKKGEEDYNPF